MYASVKQTSAFSAHLFHFEPNHLYSQYLRILRFQLRPRWWCVGGASTDRKSAAPVEKVALQKTPLREKLAMMQCRLARSRSRRAAAPDFSQHVLFRPRPRGAAYCPTATAGHGSQQIRLPLPSPRNRSRWCNCPALSDLIVWFRRCSGRNVWQRRQRVIDRKRPVFFKGSEHHLLV